MLLEIIAYLVAAAGFGLAAFIVFGFFRVALLGQRWGDPWRVDRARPRRAKRRRRSILEAAPEDRYPDNAIALAPRA